MMEREWSGILNRYGYKVELRERQGQSRQVKAFLQPILDKQPQLQPSPLGMRREEQVLYLGPGDVQLQPRQTTVIWRGQSFSVRSARRVDDGHHVWAVLQRMEESA